MSDILVFHIVAQIPEHHRSAHAKCAGDPFCHFWMKSNRQKHKTPLSNDVASQQIHIKWLRYRPIALVTLDTVLDRLPIIMLDVVNKLCVGDIFLMSDVFTRSQSSGTSNNIQKVCNRIQPLYVLWHNRYKMRLDLPQKWHYSKLFGSKIFCNWH